MGSTGMMRTVLSLVTRIPSHASQGPPCFGISQHQESRNWQIESNDRLLGVQAIWKRPRNYSMDQLRKPHYRVGVVSQAVVKMSCRLVSHRRMLIRYMVACRSQMLSSTLSKTLRSIRIYSCPSGDALGIPTTSTSGNRLTRL